MKTCNYVYIISCDGSILAAYSSEEKLNEAKTEIADEQGMGWEELEGWGYSVTICRLDRSVYK